MKLFIWLDRVGFMISETFWRGWTCRSLQWPPWRLPAANMLPLAHNSSVDLCSSFVIVGLFHPRANCQIWNVSILHGLLIPQTFQLDISQFTVNRKSYVGYMSTHTYDCIIQMARLWFRHPGLLLLSVFCVVYFVRTFCVIVCKRILVNANKTWNPS